MTTWFDEARLDDDKALRAEAARMQLDIDPMPGGDLQTLVAGIYATPPHLVERARRALSAKPAAMFASSSSRSPIAVSCVKERRKSARWGSWFQPSTG